MSIPSINSAFESFGLTVGSNANIFKINNSHCIPKKVALEIISSAKYCPIFSENRIDGNLVFTVVPYKKEEHFEKAECRRKDIPYETLWESIESTHSLLEEGKPIIVDGKKIFNDPLEGINFLASACNKMSSLVVEFFDRAPEKGTVLDLGCGTGVNSIRFLQNGWNVLAADLSEGALRSYKNTVSKTHGEYIKNGQLNLICGDITTVEIPPQSCDLIICVDVFPYIESSKLKALMIKIHRALVLDGILIGTLFFSPQCRSSYHELKEKLGVHFYQGEYIAPALLEHSGFHVDECSIRFDTGIEPECVEFMATKPYVF